MFHYIYEVLSHFQPLSPTKSPILPYDASITRLIFLSLRASLFPVIASDRRERGNPGGGASLGASLFPVIASRRLGNLGGGHPLRLLRRRQSRLRRAKAPRNDEEEMLLIMDEYNH